MAPSAARRSSPASWRERSAGPRGLAGGDWEVATDRSVHGSGRFLDLVQTGVYGRAVTTQRQDGMAAGLGPEPAMSDRALEAELRAAGLRVTSPRLAALSAIAATPHADADTIATAVRERLGTVSKQAVYDILNALTAVGLVRRVAVDERRARYELHRDDNHHHFVCRECGRIDDVACSIGAAPCLDPALDARFTVERADIVYHGLCPACTSARTSGRLDPPAAV